MPVCWFMEDSGLGKAALVCALLAGCSVLAPGQHDKSFQPFLVGMALPGEVTLRPVLE